MTKHQPANPVYVLSKGRFENCMTAKFLVKDDIQFSLVVEPQEADDYIQRYGADRVLILPPESSGYGAIPVRNWIWEHSISLGYDWHWILDDNMRIVKRRYKCKRLPCNSGTAMQVVEKFVDRYSNIGIAGLNYDNFCLDKAKLPPFRVNCHVYSFMMVRNNLPFRWRGSYNADTDLCLQSLAHGECTVQLNAFLVEKKATMLMKGGNTDRYQGEGRLKMARELQKRWPGVVKIGRRHGRPQHAVDWRKFKFNLQRKPGLDFTAMPAKDELGMKLRKQKDIRSERVHALWEKFNSENS